MTRMLTALAVVEFRQNDELYRKTVNLLATNDPMRPVTGRAGRVLS